MYDFMGHKVEEARPAEPVETLGFDTVPDAGDVVRVVENDRVLVVDFKTLRSPPATEAAVSPVYLRQLALYCAALAHIYPEHEIRCVGRNRKADTLRALDDRRVHADHLAAR